MKKSTKLLLRWLLYLLGMLILAVGLTLNSKLSLGSTPVISVPCCISEVTDVSIGDTVLAWYLTLIAVQIALKAIRRRKDGLLQDVLQLPLSFIFTRGMNLFSGSLPAFATDCLGNIWGSTGGRLLLLMLSILFIGIGAALTLDMRLIPNPGDGVVQAISDFAGKPLGITKNFFDLGCVIMSSLVSLMLTRSIIGVGVGTLLAALGVGRVIAVFNKLFGNRLSRIS